MDATFLMSNMLPQAPDLNRGPWEKMEHYCRDVARDVAGVDQQANAGDLGAERAH